eukprot:gene1078-2107_t
MASFNLHHKSSPELLIRETIGGIFSSVHDLQGKTKGSEEEISSFPLQKMCLTPQSKGDNESNGNHKHRPVDAYTDSCKTTEAEDITLSSEQTPTLSRSDSKMGMINKIQGPLQSIALSRKRSGRKGRLAILFGQSVGQTKESPSVASPRAPTDNTSPISSRRKSTGEDTSRRLSMAAAALAQLEEDSQSGACRSVSKPTGGGGGGVRRRYSLYRSKSGPVYSSYDAKGKVSSLGLSMSLPVSPTASIAVEPDDEHNFPPPLCLQASVMKMLESSSDGDDDDIREFFVEEEDENFLQKPTRR